MPEDNIDNALDIPADYIEPIGRLAIVGSQIDLIAAMAYRAFLHGVHPQAKLALLDGQGFDRLAKGVRRFTRMSIVSEIDGALADDWTEWENKARAFMLERNIWVHAVWARSSTGERIPISPVKGNTGRKPTSAFDIALRAANGRLVAIEGQAFLARILTVVRSDAYQVTPPSNFPDGVEPF